MANIGLLEVKGHLGVDQDFKITTFPTFANFWCQVFCLFYAKMTISKKEVFLALTAVRCQTTIMTNIGLLDVKGHLGVDQDFKITTFPTFSKFWCFFCNVY